MAVHTPSAIAHNLHLGNQFIGRFREFLCSEKCVDFIGNCFLLVKIASRIRSFLLITDFRVSVAIDKKIGLQGKKIIPSHLGFFS